MPFNIHCIYLYQQTNNDMSTARYITKSVKGFHYPHPQGTVVFRGMGIFDKKEQKFVKMSEGRPYTPAGGRSTAKEVAAMCERNEIIGGVKLISHIKKVA